MIKINLATRKQATVLNTAARPKMQVDVGSALKDPIIRRVLGTAAVCALGYWLLIDHQEKTLAEAIRKTEELNAENVRLTAESSKLKDYEALMRALGEDEQLLRRKLDVLRTLVADRSAPPKMLIAIAESVSADTWLTQFKVEKTDITIGGAAADFNRISDVIRRLSESAHFTDVTLKDSEERVDRGSKVAFFELTAKRRK